MDMFPRLPSVDFSKIVGPYPLLAVLLVFFAIAVMYWLFQAESTTERVICGVIMALILTIALYVIPFIAREQSEQKREQERVDRSTPIEKFPEEKVALEGPPPEVKIEFCEEKEDVEKKMTDLLKETRDTLYYYGGAGFIGAYENWKNVLNEKLDDRTVNIVRFIQIG